jgi:hypothetical protein
MHPGLIPITRQIEAMADRWPAIALVEADDRSALWEGLLRPEEQDYRIRIFYRVPFVIEQFNVSAVQPRVQVLDPVLERHDDYEEGPIPHVYKNDAEPALPYLCLFDPFNREWTPADLLSETTVPWTARNLYFYKGWLLTGRWKGGGRHPRAEELGGRTRRDKTIAQV